MPTFTYALNLRTGQSLSAVCPTTMYVHVEMWGSKVRSVFQMDKLRGCVREPDFLCDSVHSGNLCNLFQFEIGHPKPHERIPGLGRLTTKWIATQGHISPQEGLILAIFTTEGINFEGLTFSWQRLCKMLRRTQTSLVRDLKWGINPQEKKDPNLSHDTTEVKNIYFWGCRFVWSLAFVPKMEPVLARFHWIGLSSTKCFQSVNEIDGNTCLRKKVSWS